MTLLTVELDDRYDLSVDRVFITGTQALVRLCLMRSALDTQAGLNTAGYVSGYRGSPLGGLDQQFPRAASVLDSCNIHFEPALNEDLAATAIWGTQQAELRGEGQYDGVFGLWYGKGPGVDRSGDALRHANLAGTSPHGGVLVLTGDDHTCESSTTCHQSEYALQDAMIPVLNPASIQEIIQYGLHGWALSRYAGVWCGLKAVKDNIESTASVDVSLHSFNSDLPPTSRKEGSTEDDTENSLNIRLRDTPQLQEQRLHQHKLKAVQAYVRHNQLDRRMFVGGGQPRIGIVSTGKSWLDTVQALEALGIDDTRAQALGITTYKVAMSWPLEPSGIVSFATGLDLIIVVEEKRGLIEEQVKSLLYHNAHRPVVIGKQDEQGQTLFQSEAALNPVQIALAIGQRILAAGLDEVVQQRVADLQTLINTERESLAVLRKPYFCAGCPHNSSTRIPDGARAYAGIGCHYMVQFMDRNTEGYTHMGAEGANWIGESKFSTRQHVFQNMGDGTYNHSGIMAIRAAISANTHMTFKLLFNDAVAMTGGQAHEGGLTPYDIAHDVTAAGATRVAYVTDQPEQVDRQRLPATVNVDHRDNLISVQESLAQAPGVTVLIYEQTCAAEKRRRRKRGIMPDPPKRLFINDAVCEGCGDCGVKSNCVAVVPLETPFGRKREIDQSSCNKDYSCVKGFCPSFVSIEGGALRRPVSSTASAATASSAAVIPPPAQQPSLESPYAIVLTGVGGTGVVTIGALLGMAAHLQGLGCGIIDMAGLAQKGGAVVSHIKLSATPEDIHAIRIAAGGADLLLGCDLLVAASDAVVRTLDPERSRVITNTHEMITGEFTHNRQFSLPTDAMHAQLESAIADTDRLLRVDATQMAKTLLGDTIAANLFLLGAAWQRGWIPLQLDALQKAIELNGVAITLNQQAFEWGRQFVHDPDAVMAQANALRPVTETVVTLPQTLDALISQNSEQLALWKNRAWARRYVALIERCRDADTAKSKPFTRAVATQAHRLMSYKDEYEVARLYTDGRFLSKVSQQFEGDYTLKLHLAPPLLSRKDKQTGHLIKREFGVWVLTVMSVLKRFKFLRGSLFDPFGYTNERKRERALLTDYLRDLEQWISLLPDANNETYQKLVALASAPDAIKGFGHVKEAAMNDYDNTRQLLKADLKNGRHSHSVDSAA